LSVVALLAFNFRVVANGVNQSFHRPRWDETQIQECFFMNNLYRVTGIVISILLLTACKQSDRYTQNKIPSRPDVPSGAGAMNSPNPSPDYSLPPKSSANTSDSSASLTGKANPLGEMTKQEESTSMPLPRQANDHSSDVPKIPKQ
jgi:hypothetical protein